MLKHITLYQLDPGVTHEKLEAMMRQTRIRLLKIQEILAVKCGRSIRPEEGPWGFFTAIEVESSEKLAVTQEDAIYIKYMEEIIKPNTVARMALDYEMDPARDIRYS